MYIYTIRKVNDMLRIIFVFQIKYINSKRIGYGFYIELYETQKYMTRKYTTQYDYQIYVIMWKL